MSLLRTGLFATFTTMIVLTMGCSSEPISEQAVARAEADCQVTGSNLKRRSADCAAAQKAAGVQEVSAEAIQSAASKGGTKQGSTMGGN